jgi:hypothetical protein
MHKDNKISEHEGLKVCRDMASQGMTDIISDMIREVWCSEENTRLRVDGDIEKFESYFTGVLKRPIYVIND